MGGGGLAAFPPLNRPVFVDPKYNLLSAGANHVSLIIIVYQIIVWLFSPLKDKYISITM